MIVKRAAFLRATRQEPCGSDKSLAVAGGQINMINQLDEEDRTVVFKIIDTMLTKKKFKDFFNNNVAAL